MTGVIDRIRRPEYTGDNRCVPCTVVNVVVAAVAGLVAGVVVPVAGLAVFAVALVLIYLRGYLVPGTPTLTRRYLPERILAAVGKEPQPRDTPTWDAIERHKQRNEQRVDPEQYLVDGGVVESTDGDHRLAPSFAKRLENETETLDERRLWWTDDGVGCDREALADLLGVGPDDIQPRAEDHPAVRVGPRVRQWPSATALAADVAGDRAIRATVPDWGTVPLDQRLQLLSAVRSFREQCPCGGVLSETTEPVDSCCRSGTVSARICEQCDETLLEYSGESPAWFSPVSQ